MAADKSFEFVFYCPFCRQKFIADIMDIGQTAICSDCGKEIVIEPHTQALDGLNYRQKMAAITSNGIIRVIAGAGTGKTRVLVHRLASLIQTFGIPQENILSVTFTNKAAGVMKRRARDLLGSDFASRISTFHGFCHELLKEDIHYLNFPSGFCILDTEDQKQILEEIYKEQKISPKMLSYKEAIQKISELKHHTPYEPYLTQGNIRDAGFFLLGNSLEEIIFNHYLLKQRRAFHLDFDDLILFAIHVLSTFDDVREKWNDRIHYIQVDEFQDVNETQFILLSLLSEKYKNIFVVGDPDQNIYTWRGARLRFFLGLEAWAADLEQKFLNVILEDNYRSSQSILTISNQMISYNSERIPKNLRAVVARNEIKPFFYHGKDNILETKWIASQIKFLVENKIADYDDIAVLLRGMPSSRTVENTFVAEKVPYRIIDGLRFYERKEIKDVRAYLRLLTVDDDLSFSRIINMPPRGIGESRRNFLKKYAAEHDISLWEAFKRNAGIGIFADKYFKKGAHADSSGYLPLSPVEFVNVIERLRDKLSSTSLSDLLVDVLQETGYEAYLLQSGDDDRKDNLRELKGSIISRENEAEECINLNDYLNEIALYAEKQENVDENMVKIMTVHAAKGLEFPIVFVPFFNEGFLPSRKAHKPNEIEEERRVAYVAFTRAEKQLFISNSDGHEEYHYLQASRFLTEIEMDCLQIEGVVPAEYWEAAKKHAQTMAQTNQMLFVPGNCVMHEQFGKGIVVAIQNSVIRVRFESGQEGCFNDFVLQKVE